MRTEKGFESVAIPFVFAIGIFFLVVIGIFLVEIQFNGALKVSTEGSFNRYRAHQAAAAIQSDEDIMLGLSRYTVMENDAEGLKSELKDVLGNTTGAYVFRLQEKQSQGWEEMLKVENNSAVPKRYSSIYIRSPSNKTYRMVVGIGG